MTAGCWTRWSRKSSRLEAGKLKIWAGNYSWYATERELARLRQQQLFTAQQKRIRQIEEAIKRFEHWARITEDPRHARKARHRRRMLERMEEKGEMVEKVVERRQLDAEFTGWRGSTKALEITRAGDGLRRRAALCGPGAAAASRRARRPDRPQWRGQVGAFPPRAGRRDAAGWPHPGRAGHEAGLLRAGSRNAGRMVTAHAAGAHPRHSAHARERGGRLSC